MTRRIRDARWGALGAALIPSVGRAEVQDKMAVPWEPVPVLMTLALCVVCAALVRARWRGAWRVATCLALVWTACMFQTGIFDPELGALLRNELLPSEFQAHRGLVVVEALLPAAATLLALLTRRVRLQAT